MAIKIIGITGQVGSGKSTVAKLIQERCSAHLLIADDIGRRLMDKDNISYGLIVNYFGKEIVNDDLSINRNKLGEIVFRDPDKLETLNSFIHPYVMNEVFDEIQRIKKEYKEGIILIEAAILIESGYKEICDEIWYVAISQEVRENRLKTNRGYSLEKIMEILKNQLSDEEFRANATMTINNNGNLEDIIAQIEHLLVN